MKFAYGDVTGKRGIVATESNVVAALNLKTGELFSVFYCLFCGYVCMFSFTLTCFSGNILWRQILEREPLGKILYLSPSSSSEAIIVSGGSKPLVRSFDSINGALGWEWPLPGELNLDTVIWAVSTDKLYAVSVNNGLEFVVHQFSLRSGAQTGKWQNNAPWAHKNK